MPFLKVLVVGITVSLFINSGFVVAEWYATSKNGSDVLLWVSLLLVLPLLLSLLIGLACLLGTFTHWKEKSLKISVGSLAFFIVGVLMIQAGGWLRLNEFSKLAERSEPIILAIERFEKETGHAPKYLDMLVPVYLPEIPKTKMGAYPNYSYYAGTKAEEYAGNPWVLEIFSPTAGINFDLFFYFPLQNYPKHGYGGVLEKIGKWAYVHE